MKVRVLFFAGLKDVFKKEEIILSLPFGSTLQVLLQEVFRDRKDMDQSLKSIFLAVNHHYSSMETVLNEGDEVALLPPMAGG